MTGQQYPTLLVEPSHQAGECGIWEERVFPWSSLSQLALSSPLFCHAHSIHSFSNSFPQKYFVCIYCVTDTMLNTEDATLFNTYVTDLTQLNVQPHSFKYERQGHCSIIICINIAFYSSDLLDLIWGSWDIVTTKILLFPSEYHRAKCT